MQFCCKAHYLNNLWQPLCLFSALQEDKAMSFVAGFTVAHDVSARDWQMTKNSGQWLLSKTFDTFCPLGPALVTTAALSGQ